MFKKIRTSDFKCHNPPTLLLVGSCCHHNRFGWIFIDQRLAFGCATSAPLLIKGLGGWEKTSLSVAPFSLEPKWPGHREVLLPPFHPIKSNQSFCFEIALLSLKHPTSSVTTHPPSFWLEAVAITTGLVGSSLTNVWHLGAPLLHLFDFVAPLHCGKALGASML